MNLFSKLWTISCLAFFYCSGQWPPIITPPSGTAQLGPILPVSKATVHSKPTLAQPTSVRLLPSPMPDSRGRRRSAKGLSGLCPRICTVGRG
ncbi:hypothetical protein BDV11DRAFT_199821 [Aspergillus similis]